MKNKYPRFFIRADGKPFTGKMKSLSFARINKVNDAAIFKDSNHTVQYSEKECDNLVKLGIWKEIKENEVVLL